MFKRPDRKSLVCMAIGVLLLAVSLTATACGSGDDASREDAHDVRGNLVDKSRPHIVTFNNRFPNIASKCLGAPEVDVDGAPQGERQPNDTAENGGGWRVVVTTAKKVLLVQDPDCPGYRKGANLPPAVIAP